MRVQALSTHHGYDYPEAAPFNADQSQPLRLVFESNAGHPDPSSSVYCRHRVEEPWQYQTFLLSRCDEPLESTQETG
jgi:hypothetical protein